MNKTLTNPAFKAGSSSRECAAFKVMILNAMFLRTVKESRAVEIANRAGFIMTGDKSFVGMEA